MAITGLVTLADRQKLVLMSSPPVRTLWSYATRSSALFGLKDLMLGFMNRFERYGTRQTWSGRAICGMFVKAMASKADSGAAAEHHSQAHR